MDSDFGYTRTPRRSASRLKAGSELTIWNFFSGKRSNKSLSPNQLCNTPASGASKVITDSGQSSIKEKIWAKSECGSIHIVLLIPIDYITKNSCNRISLLPHELLSCSSERICNTVARLKIYFIRKKRKHPNIRVCQIGLELCLKERENRFPTDSA